MHSSLSQAFTGPTGNRSRTTSMTESHAHSAGAHPSNAGHAAGKHVSSSSHSGPGVHFVSSYSGPGTHATSSHTGQAAHATSCNPTSAGTTILSATSQSVAGGNAASK